MAKSNDKPGNDWYSKAEICRFQGIAEQTFDKTYRGVIPPAAVKKIGARVWYQGPAYLEAVLAKKLADAKPSTAEADPMLAGGGDSVWLEKYRQQKTRLATMEADERQGLTVQVAVIEPLLLQSLGTVRRSIEIVEREHGRDAVLPITEAIDNAIQDIEKHFADGNGRKDAVTADAGIAQTASASVDAGICGK